MEALVPSVLSAQTTLLLGVSGGPDSQVLMDIIGRMYRAQRLCRVIALGIDHGLRPAADGELAMAAALARHHGILFFKVCLSLHKEGNILHVARQARYRVLRQYAQCYGAKWIVLGHHGDDQVETILWRMCRGSALRGMAGMSMYRGDLARPLLIWSKAQILAYAQARGLPFACDPSNEHPQRMRAYLRKQVTPMLSGVNRQYRRHIQQWSEWAEDDANYLEQQAYNYWQTQQVQCAGGVYRDKLGGLPAALGKRVLQLWLRGVLEQPLPLLGLKKLWVTLRSDFVGWFHIQGISLYLDKQTCVFEQRQHKPLQVAWQNRCLFTAKKQQKRCCFVPEFAHGLHLNILDVGVWRERSALPDERQCIICDVDRIAHDLALRVWRFGDRLRLPAQRGRIKVGDLFTNSKIPLNLRLVWPLLFCGDELLWVVGLRRGDLCWVGPRTQRILIISWGKNECTWRCG